MMNCMPLCSTGFTLIQKQLIVQCGGVELALPILKDCFKLEKILSTGEMQQGDEVCRDPYRSPTQFSMFGKASMVQDAQSSRLTRGSVMAITLCVVGMLIYRQIHRVTLWDNPLTIL
jgi:hypothetical protein